MRVSQKQASDTLRCRTAYSSETEALRVHQSGQLPFRGSMFLPNRGDREIRNVTFPDGRWKQGPSSTFPGSNKAVM